MAERRSESIRDGALASLNFRAAGVYSVKLNKSIRSLMAGELVGT
jgi:hypothetical protein